MKKKILPFILAGILCLEPVQLAAHATYTIDQDTIIVAEEPLPECVCEYRCSPAFTKGKYYDMKNSKCLRCWNGQQEECEGKQLIAGGDPDCEHEFGTKVTYFNATCTTPWGYKIKCGCGAEWIFFKETNPVNLKSPHYYGSYEPYIEQKEPTCIEEGYRKYIPCLLCGETVEETIPASGIHQAPQEVEVIPAGCTTDGSKIYVCTVCGETVTDIIPMTGHQRPTEIEHKDSTCAEEGYNYYICTSCGQEVTETIEKKNHSFSRSNKGVCKNCKHTIYRVATYEVGAEPTGSDALYAFALIEVDENNELVHYTDAYQKPIEGPITVATGRFPQYSVMGKTRMRTLNGERVMSKVIGFQNSNQNSPIYQVGDEFHWQDVLDMEHDDYLSSKGHKLVLLKAVCVPVIEGEFKHYDYNNELSEPNEGLRKETTPTSDGIISQFDYADKGLSCVITYIIPENYAGDSITINATLQLMEAFKHIQDTRWPNEKMEPGDTVGPVQIRIVNNSGIDYTYRTGSMILQSPSYQEQEELSDMRTFDGTQIPVRAIPNRNSRDILQYLYGVDGDLTKKSLSDEALGAKLVEKGYAGGIADLHQYYLDYYNNAFGKDYGMTWSNLSELPVELLTDRDMGLYGGWSSTSGTRETNPEVAGVGYSLMYTKLFCVIPGTEIDMKDKEGTYAVANYMHGLQSYDESAQEIWGTLKAGETSQCLEGMSLYINGLAQNVYQETEYGIEVQFQLDAVPTSTPTPTESVEPTPSSTPIPIESIEPTPAPTASVKPTPTPSESVMPSSTPVPSETITPTPEPPKVTPSESIIPTPTPIPSESITPEPPESTPIPSESITSEPPMVEPPEDDPPTQPLIEESPSPEPSVEDFIDPDVPLAGLPDPWLPEPEPSVEELEDPETPLAQVPQTGDSITLWLSLFALAGVSLFALGKRKSSFDI